MKRPFQNLLSLASGDLGSRLIGFLISVYLARVLEPRGFGLLSMGLSALGYLQLAGSPGIQLLETRNAAAFVDVDRARVGAVLSLRLILAAGLWICTAVCVSVLFPGNATGLVITLFALSLFPVALTLDWFFQGKEDFVTVGASRLGQFAAYGLAVALLVHETDDVGLAAIAYILGTVVAAGIFWAVHARRWGSLNLAWSPALWKDIIRKGLPVGAAMFLAQSVTNLPPLAIGYFSSQADVGLFSSAMKLVFLLLIIDRLFNALFLPVVTRYFSHRSEDVSMLIGTTLRIVLAVVVPLAIMGIILGRTAMTAFFGESYAEGTVPLQILMPYFALTVLNSVFVCILVGSGHEKEYTKTLTQGSIVVCLAVVGGTGWFGAEGAAAGVVLGELVTLGLMIRASTRLVSVPVTGTLARPLVAGGCMTASVFLFREAGLVPVIALSLAVFIAVQILLKGITMREIRFLRERFM